MKDFELTEYKELLRLENSRVWQESYGSGSPQALLEGGCCSGNRPK